MWRPRDGGHRAPRRASRLRGAPPRAAGRRLRGARPHDRRPTALQEGARSIYARLTALFGDRAPKPFELISTDEELLRAAGLSRPKIRYLRDLADHVLSGELDLAGLQDLSDEDAAARIVAVKGLGRWSADMFLMFHLGREDVLPVGDLGIRRAVEKAYDLPDAPAPDALRELAAAWRPHRTLASLYLWESLDNKPAVEGAPA